MKKPSDDVDAGWCAVLARSAESAQLATHIIEVVRASLKAQVSEHEKAGH